MKLLQYVIYNSAYFTAPRVWSIYFAII